VHCASTRANVACPPIGFASAHADLVSCGLHAWSLIITCITIMDSTVFLYLRTIIEIFRVCSAAMHCPRASPPLSSVPPAQRIASGHARSLGPARMQVPPFGSPLPTTSGPASEPSTPGSLGGGLICW
jgi:hypothetical protein